jgi:RNA binding exosome subunit
MVELTEKIDVEKMLSDYKKMTADITVLAKYPIGMGMYIDQTNDGDLLQDLHKILKKMPTYMYLNNHEQEIERVANEYMYDHPIGIRSQLYQVRGVATVDDEDEKRMKQLKSKLKKAIEVRRGELNDKDYSKVLNRICRLQELQDQKELIDTAMAALEEYQEHLAKLLKLKCIEGETREKVAVKLNISTRTFDRWKDKAIEEFTRFYEMTVN